ncbi:hypothetical protein IF1G_03972 [Cordyceps javanica]|uniref:Uncharacterized protein n=1 Tax=Cordyceps javanica TaxID=43265 RepID=A0A545V4U7_9HYPO|nr:hypothetical protein IF1G_03972 [Cordyceps javanica]
MSTSSIAVQICIGVEQRPESQTRFVSAPREFKLQPLLRFHPTATGYRCLFLLLPQFPLRMPSAVVP